MQENQEANRAETKSGHSSRAIFPALATVYPAIWLYAQNFGEVTLASLALVVTACSAAGLLIWWVLALEIPTRNGRGLVYIYAVFPTLMLGYLLTELRGLSERVGIPPVIHLRAEIAGLVLGLIGLYFLYRRVRRGGEFVAATRFLNAIFVCLLALAFARIGVQAAGGFESGATDATARPLLTGGAPGERPNIYVIVLDAYAGGEVLRNRYDHDNEPFYAALEAQGFAVARDAHAHYPFTVLSLASLFNMEYILGGGDPESAEPIPFDYSFKSETRYSRQLRTALVVRDLRALGYEFLSFESGVNVTLNVGADRTLSPSRSFSEFDRTFLENTAVYPAMLALGVPIDEYVERRAQRRRLLFTFDEIGKIPVGAQPKLVLAHVLAPHPPFVFYEDGSPRPESGAGRASTTFPEAYAGFLRYTNTLVLDAMAAIRANDPGGVILLMGDHGPRYEVARETFPWEDYAQDWLTTLTAVHLPDSAGETLPIEDLSHANLFRIVFNRCFGTSYELLPSMSYLRGRTARNVLVPVRWDGNEPIPLSELE